MDYGHGHGKFSAVVQLVFGLSMVIIQSALGAPESDLVKNLPGQTQDVTFKQYGGYITTDEHNGRALFYYFVEAVSNSTSKPLTLWLNGGPGCSSLGFGAFMEHGPFKPKGKVLLQNKYAWNIETNILYVESPIGVGFSYSNTSSDYIDWNDTFTAQDNLVFLLHWFEKFPEYKGVDFYLTGESYAGHYLPQLATLVLDYNKRPNITSIKLKGIAIGNPLLDIDISVNNGAFLWTHGLISDKTYQLVQNVCNNSRFLREYYHDQWSQACNDVYNNVTADIGDDVDQHDVTSDRCLSDLSLQTLLSGKLGKLQQDIQRKVNRLDLCIQDEISAYLNRDEVQKALHANTTGLPSHWRFCLGPLLYQEDNMVLNIIPVISNLLKADLPIMFYSGDQDAQVPLTGTRTIANHLAKQLKLFTLVPYGPWYDEKQVAGWTQAYGHPVKGKNLTILTYATVRGAAHEVPYTSPSQALTLITAFIRRLPLSVIGKP